MSILNRCVIIFFFKLLFVRLSFFRIWKWDDNGYVVYKIFLVVVYVFRLFIFFLIVGSDSIK